MTGHSGRASQGPNYRDGLVPADVLAAYTRTVIEDHDEWDGLHSFRTLHWDGGKLRVGTFVAIAPDVDPGDYPAMMRRAVGERLLSDPDDPPCAYVLLIEGYGVAAPAPEASRTERDRFDRARRDRTFHQMPEAQELAMAHCADIGGRMWSATKFRDRPGVIEEKFYPPGSDEVGGLLADWLLAVAYATGIRLFGKEH